MRVNCEAGYSGCDHPKDFTWLGNRLVVQQIIKEWREPCTKYFLVAAENGSPFKLIYSETSGSWKILEVSGLSNR
jgi:hypothetical protein